jgi:hypothetical protein
MKLWDILKEHNWNIDARVELLKNLDEARMVRNPNPSPNKKKDMVTIGYARTFFKDKGIDADDLTDDEIDSMATSAAESSRANIDAIDGETKKKALSLEETAPGNKSSVINEIGVGIGMSHIDENPNITPEELEEKLFKEMMDSKIGKKNGEEATRNACRAAALSSIREHSRTQQTIEKNGMSSENTKVSHVFGAKSSLENTVNHIKELGVKEINGIPFDTTDDRYFNSDGSAKKPPVPPFDPDNPNYAAIILGGGAGKNPTDTMVVMTDDSADPPKCVINHTSNKTSSEDIQGNSGPDKNADYAMKQADKDLKEGNITEQEHKKITEELTALRENFINAQNQIEELINEQFERMEADIKDPKKRKEILNTIKTLSTGAKPAKYWEQVAKRYAKSSGIDLKGRTFDYKTGDYNPPLTEEEESQILLAYQKEMKDFSNQESEAEEPPKWATEIIARKDMYPPPEEELNRLYTYQHDLITETRKKVDDVKEGYGTRIAAQNIFERLHLDVVQGHNPGGIPAENFETNMGINRSGRRYDKDGNAWHHEGRGMYRKINPETGEPEGEKQKGKELGLNDGNKAVVVNKDTIAKALGVKPPAEDILDRIRVGEVKSGKGKSGVATIYGTTVDGKEVIIGYQTIRPKQGPGSKHQDTISFHQDFQKRLVEASEEL